MLRIFALLGSAGLARSLAFAAPQPTTVDDDLARGLIGWFPKPTPGPLELFRREDAGTRTCGWYDDGFGTQTITCPTGTCMLYTPSGIVGMAGCCTSSTGGLDYQNCGWVNKCYDYLDIAVGKCDDSCMSNEFIRVCTDSEVPYCQSWTYPGPAVRDYGCGTDATSTWITVSSDVADEFDGTATAQVPFVPASATVTGWNDVASETESGSNTKPDTYTSESTGTSASLSSTTTTTSVSITLVVIISVALLLGLCCAGGIIAFFCVRSKRNVAKWANPSTGLGAAVTGQQAALLMQNQPSNVVPPPGQHGGPQSYFEQHAVPPTGAAAEYYSGREQKRPGVSSIQPPTTPNSLPSTPAPPYLQPCVAQQPPVPQKALHYAPAQPYGHPLPQHHHNGAVEVPYNPALKPAIAELG